MANGIRGITIEIGGDTTGLDNALRDVNQQSRDLQKELKEVERALRLDPGNTELVRQQQELLAQSIQASAQRLDTLRTAQAQVDAQFARGDIGAEQYRAFQRELVNTENQMTSLESRLNSIGPEQERLAQTTRQLGTFFAVTGTDVEQFSGTLGTRLTQAIRDGSASADQMERALRLMGRQALGAGVDIDEMRAALRNVDNGSSLTDVRADLEAIRPAANDASTSVEGFGDKLKGVAAGLAVGGGIAALFHEALDVSTLNTQIDISMSINEGDLSAVRSSIKGVTAAIGDEEAAYEGVRRQMVLNKDASIETNQKIIEGATAIAYAYKEIDFKELIQESFEIGKELKITQEEALALTNQLLSIGFPPEQLDIISEYGNQLQRAGFNGAEIQALFAAGVETGTWNIDNLLDGLKEGRLQMASFATAMTKDQVEMASAIDGGIAKFDQWAASVAKGGEEGSKAMQEIALMLNEMEEGAEKNDLGTMIFGTKWEDQGQNVIDTLINMNGHMIDLGDSQDKLNSDIDKMNADPAITLANAMSDLKETFAPVLADIAELIGSIASWAKDNKELAVTLTAIGTVIGIIVGAFALLAPAIAAVIPLFASGGAAAGVLGGALTVLSGPIGWTVAALAALGVGAVVVGKEMSESALQVEGWSDKVSESTAEAVGSFLDLNTQATNAMNQLNWSGTAVTQEMADNITGIYDQMGQQVLAEMQSDHAEQLASMTDYFAQSSALTEAEESQILANMQVKNAEKEKTIQDGTARITAIYNTAAKENRQISETEQTEINKIQSTMKDNAIKYMTESEREQKVILENLKNEATKITAEQAANVVNNSKKQKDETVKEANDQYKKSVAEIIKQRDEMGTISAEQAQKLIDEAKKQRDGTVKNAEEMHKNVVTEAKGQAKEHVNQVDWETGELLSKWQAYKKDVSSEWSTMVADSKKWFGDMSKGIGTEIDNAVKWVSDGVGDIVGFFTNLKIPEIKIPKPKLPTFDLTFGSKEVFGKTINFPTGFDVSWNAKGGIFNSPTIFNTANAGLQGVGEAGPEAILPLNSRTLGAIGEGIAQTMSGVIEKLSISSDAMFKVSENMQDVFSGAYSSLANSAVKARQASTTRYVSSTSTIDQSKYMQPNITIINQAQQTSPSELARKGIQEQRKLAMEWGIV